MIAEVAGQGRAMPGQMPGEDMFADAGHNDEPPAAPPAERPVAIQGDDSDVEADEAEEEDENVAVRVVMQAQCQIMLTQCAQPLPVRILRNVLNRFWGGAHNEAESSEEEGADAVPQDDQGVD